ncbi:MAG: hypothetical protein IPK25_09330 [Saprospiraceae bacterium]|nr:hypothetical protein [Saprospiraceae bacterium]
MFLIGGIVAGAIIGAMVDEHFIIGGPIGGAIGWIVGNSMESSLSSKEVSRTLLILHYNNTHFYLKERKRVGHFQNQVLKN